MSLTRSRSTRWKASIARPAASGRGRRRARGARRRRGAGRRLAVDGRGDALALGHARIILPGGEPCVVAPSSHPGGGLALADRPGARPAAHPRGEINSFSGIAAPSPALPCRRRDGVDELNAGGACWDGSGGDLPGRQGAAGGGREARPGAGGQRAGHAARRTSLQRRLAVSDWCRQNACCSWPRAADRGADVGEGPRPRLPRPPEHYQQAHAGREGRAFRTPLGHDRPNYEYGKRAWRPPGPAARAPAGCRSWRALAHARQDRAGPSSPPSWQARGPVRLRSSAATGWRSCASAQARALRRMFVVGILLGSPSTSSHWARGPGADARHGLPVVRHRAAAHRTSSPAHAAHGTPSVNGSSWLRHLLRSRGAAGREPRRPTADRDAPRLRVDTPIGRSASGRRTAVDDGA